MLSSVNIGNASINNQTPLPPSTTWINFEEVEKSQEFINKQNQINIVMTYQQLVNPNERYIIIDKENARMHIMEGGKKLDSFEVGIGRQRSDNQTVTTSDYNYDLSNFSTGSGIYTVFQANPENEDYGSPSFNLKNEQGMAVGTSIHSPPEYRKKYFNNETLEDNRMSWGCVNTQCTDLAKMYNQYNVRDGQKVFILPETQDATFEIVNGLLVHRDLSTGYNVDYNTVYKKLAFTDFEYPVQLKYGRINRTLTTLNYIPTKFRPVQSRSNPATSAFADGLSDAKQRIMSTMQVNGDVYNRIARVAFGMFGQESDFGSYSGPRGSLGRLRDVVGMAINESGMGEVAEMLGQNVSNISYGPTQIRPSSMRQIRDVLRDFDIESSLDLDDPYKAGIATTVLLIHMYQNEIASSRKQYLEQILPVLYNSRPVAKKINQGEFDSQLADGTFDFEHVNKVLAFADELEVWQDANQTGINVEEIQESINELENNCE